MPETSASGKQDAFAGRPFVVVGGSCGIGKTEAKATAEHGRRAKIASRNKAKLEVAAREIGHKAYSAHRYDERGGERCMVRRAKAGGHLFVTASTVSNAAFETLETEALRAMLDAKFLGPYLIARKVLPRLSDGGSMTLFSGVLSRHSSKGATVLGAVNTAGQCFIRGLALELGLRLYVSGIAPSMVETEAYDAMPADRRQAMLSETAARSPMKRIGSVNNTADAVPVVTTNPSMTWHIQDVDGGYLMDT